MRLRVMVTQAHFAYLVSARGAGVVPMMAGSKAPGLSDALARVHKVGPIIWAKRAAGALEGANRRELVAQVQQLLPQANDGNVVFSLHREPVYGFEQHLLSHGICGG